MHLGQETSLEHQQKLVMTQRLQQAIAILQMDAVALEERVQQELQDNPVLERVDSGEPGEDCPWEEYLVGPQATGTGAEPDDWPADEDAGGGRWEERLSWEPSFHEALLGQLRLAVSASTLRRAAAFLVENLDPDGYLRQPLPELARALGVSLAHMERALAVVQSLDPAGVGARSLSECLLLQLAREPQADPLAAQIVRTHLEDLAAGRLTHIAAELRVSVAEVQAAADHIRRLNPRPGSSLGGETQPRYIVPDAVIQLVDGEPVVLLNEAATPHLRISRQYQQIWQQARRRGEQEVLRFLHQRLNSALWLIRNIEQRQQTIYRVVQCLARRQREFLRRGSKYLRPLALRDVAQELGLHESTVSRATAHKYAQTPQGTLELRAFFSNGVACAGDHEEGRVATAGVKARLKELLAAEDPRFPASDAELAARLRQEGIRISRRTVSKYREELGVPSSRRRRRYP